MNYDKVNDSGVREEFVTGSRRDTREGKGRYDLITPIGLARLARHYENGAKKYGAFNWCKGQPLLRYLDSALRHLFSYLEGNRDEDHLAAAAWNCLSLIHTEEMIRRGVLPEALNDVPKWESVRSGQGEAGSTIREVVDSDSPVPSSEGPEALAGDGKV